MKKQINYDKFKTYLSNDNVSREDFKEEIKKHLKKNMKIKIETDLMPDKFNNSKDLLKALNKENLKFYYFTNFMFVQKICENVEVGNFSMKAMLHKDKITIIFNEKEKDELTFFNNTAGLIQKELLKSLEKDISYPFKKDLEILIRLYYNYRFLKEKENTKFELLNEDNSQMVYLINNNWIEKYKSFFEYRDLKNYLLELNKTFKLYPTNFNSIKEDYIDKIISILPEDYIDKLKKKNKFDIPDKIDKYENNIIKKTFDSKNIEISYSINNQIINYRIYVELNKILAEGIYAQLKICDIYFIGNNKILLFNKEFDNFNYEIGFINEENIFITEYIIYSENKKFEITKLNYFFEKKFDSFAWDEQKESCHINDNNIKIGKCFKIIKASNKEATNKSNTSKILNQSSQIDDIPLDGHLKQNLTYIKLFLEIYIFRENMKNRINQNLINSKKENYYIIKKKWMNVFMEYLKYNEFIEYIKKGNINDIINKYRNNNSQFLLEINKLLPNDYLKKIKEKTEDRNKLDEFKNAVTYEFKLKNRIPFQNKSIYYYYDNIEIMNEEIFNYIKDILNIQNGNKRVFLIGDNKIIMELNLTYQYSLIIGNYVDFSFVPSILIDFNVIDYYNSYFKKFIEKGYKDK